MVAPLVGAWIEIFKNWAYQNVLGSLLSWERGLKSFRVTCKGTGESVAPLVGAWIEIGTLMDQRTGKASLLSWERGLKYHT